jgi:2,3-diketo-5-methylthio-1-phosphopentane phosphatase
MTLAIFTDFDETITRVNVTDTLLEKFAHPSWRAIQDEWLAGKLSAREVLERQMPLVSVAPGDLNAFIESVEVDPFFADFVGFCRREGHDLYVLSDGFDYWIERILERVLSPLGEETPVPVFACHLTLPATEVEISFPYFPEGCSHGCATCKPALFARLRRDARSTVVIGDGSSDFLLSRSADLVLAKGTLRRYCQSHHAPYESFENFSDVIEKVRRFGDSFREAAPQ